LILFIKCVIYRLCLNIKIFKKFFPNSALMIIRYSTVSSVFALWLLLGYVYFFYLLRMVVFFNRYRSLDCCTVLSGKVFCSFCCCDVFRCFVSCFSFLVVGLVLQRGCVYLLLDVGTTQYLVPYCFFTVM